MAQLEGTSAPRRHPGPGSVPSLQEAGHWGTKHLVQWEVASAPGMEHKVSVFLLIHVYRSRVSGGAGLLVG